MSRPELELFARSFARAIRLEMKAMERRLGSFGVAIGEGRRVEVGSPGAWGERERLRYRFRALERKDKLLAGIECTLPLTSSPCVLVVYPWFRYERLMLAVEEVPESDTHCPARALAAFGKEPPSWDRDAAPLSLHEELNASQRDTVRLCLRSKVPFVWGSPGTGKTMTLGRIVQELHARGMRVLLTSTAKAAVDQALAELASLPALAPALEAGEIVRAG